MKKHIYGLFICSILGAIVARTVLFVAARNVLYVAVPARAAAPAEVLVYAVQ